MHELARFFDLSLDLLCIADFDGYFKRLNPAWTARLGWTLEELKGRPFIDFIHPDDREATRVEASRLAHGAKALRFENRYRHQDGSYRWLRWNARSMLKHQQIYAVARDVTRQKRLEREILEIADREKEHLGRELHDGLCQNLAGISALSSTLSRSLAAQVDSGAAAAAAEIARLLNETIHQARDLARGLGPLGLNDIGLDGALETLALNVQHSFGVTCVLECDCFSLRLRRQIEGHLLRITQEAVNNAVTHGQAQRIEISLRAGDEKVVLSICDDGVGLAEDARKAGGVGLHTMAYRAHLIGGSLEVQRRARCGTVVICNFPLPKISDSREQRGHVRHKI